jgi:hypothetical protein
MNEPDDVIGPCVSPGLEGKANCKDIGWLDKPFTPNCFCKHAGIGPFQARGIDDAK